MKYILLSHGNLAGGLLDGVQMILGEQENITALSLKPEMDLSHFTEMVKKELNNSETEEVICFTDLFHGSPFNVAVSLMNDFEFEHITGMNLAIVIEGIMLRNNNLSSKDIVEKLIVEGNNSIMDVNKLVKEKLK